MRSAAVGAIWFLVIFVGVGIAAEALPRETHRQYWSDGYSALIWSFGFPLAVLVASFASAANARGEVHSRWHLPLVTLGTWVALALLLSGNLPLALLIFCGSMLGAAAGASRPPESEPAPAAGADPPEDPHGPRIHVPILSGLLETCLGWLRTTWWLVRYPGGVNPSREGSLRRSSRYLTRAIALSFMIQIPVSVVWELDASESLYAATSFIGFVLLFLLYHVVLVAFGARGGLRGTFVVQCYASGLSLPLTVLSAIPLLWVAGPTFEPTSGFSAWNTLWASLWLETYPWLKVWVLTCLVAAAAIGLASVRWCCMAHGLPLSRALFAIVLLGVTWSPAAEIIFDPAWESVRAWGDGVRERVVGSSMNAP